MKNGLNQQLSGKKEDKEQTKSKGNQAGYADKNEQLFTQQKKRKKETWCDRIWGQRKGKNSHKTGSEQTEQEIINQKARQIQTVKQNNLHNYPLNLCPSDHN